MDVTYRPIGVIHSPFVDLKGMPIQPAGQAAAPGRAEVFPEFGEGLKDLDGFSHVILLYHLHEVRRAALTVKPFLGRELRGVFSTRAPTRPNPIGLSIVELVQMEGNMLHLANVDILDATPLLDIKPYVPQFKQPRNVRTGWLAAAGLKVKPTKSDDRFASASLGRSVHHLSGHRIVDHQDGGTLLCRNLGNVGVWVEQAVRPDTVDLPFSLVLSLEDVVLHRTDVGVRGHTPAGA
jgi:tRNA-Thr(GGU) m(6)t(6)A37 methyltransferase TsaA